MTDATEIYVIMAAHPEGGEGIATITTPIGQLPLVATDYEQMRELIPHAVAMVQQGQDVTLVRFSRREDITKFKGVATATDAVELLRTLREFTPRRKGH